MNNEIRGMFKSILDRLASGQINASQAEKERAAIRAETAFTTSSHGTIAPTFQVVSKADQKRADDERIAAARASIPVVRAETMTLAPVSAPKPVSKSVKETNGTVRLLSDAELAANKMLAAAAEKNRAEKAQAAAAGKKEKTVALPVGMAIVGGIIRPVSSNVTTNPFQGEIDRIKARIAAGEISLEQGREEMKRLKTAPPAPIFDPNAPTAASVMTTVRCVTCTKAKKMDPLCMSCGGKGSYPVNVAKAAERMNRGATALMAVDTSNAEVSFTFYGVHSCTMASEDGPTAIRDIKNTLLGSGGDQGEFQRAVLNSGVIVTMHLSEKPCSHCQGKAEVPVRILTGKESGMAKCLQCKAGYVEGSFITRTWYEDQDAAHKAVLKAIESGKITHRLIECDSCGGHGILGEEPCEDCHGQGERPESFKISNILTKAEFLKEARAPKGNTAVPSRKSGAFTTRGTPRYDTAESYLGGLPTFSSKYGGMSQANVANRPPRGGWRKGSKNWLASQGKSE